MLRASAVAFLFAHVGCASAHLSTRSPASAGETYQGCLLFIEDARTFDDLALAQTFAPNLLIRSWYRFGEPDASKAYSKRGPFVEALESKGIFVGGGTSLSVVSDEDLKDVRFDRSWLAKNLDGSEFENRGKKYGSLSDPGFRHYLISKVIEQVRAGAKELHLGESTGKIRYEDWTLGTTGDFGFIHWIKEKYKNRPTSWWQRYLGDLGKNIAHDRPITRSMFLALNSKQQKNFKTEWGEEDSWHGRNEKGQPEFLATIYKQNLEKFLQELKTVLKMENLDASIDVWGIADWMPAMSTQPDAYIVSPPDDRESAFKWSTDPNYPVEQHRKEIKDWMARDVKSVSPVPVVFMFDHPNPFYTSFLKLSDDRQAYLTQFFARLSSEVGSNFIFRGYSLSFEEMGVSTEAVIMDECRRKHQKEHQG